MARTYSPLSIALLRYIAGRPSVTLQQLYEQYSSQYSNKLVYDALFRLSKNGLIEAERGAYRITADGIAQTKSTGRARDGVWKLVIFDIPEKDRSVRNFLRQRLKMLGFQKWQNSIWVSPYVIEESIEHELKDLTKHYFVRLIKSDNINNTEDLEAMFPSVDSQHSS